MTTKNEQNNDRDAMIKDILENNKFLTPESDMNFKCDSCGKCCHNQDIILSTLDIVRLRCALNLPTPHILADYVTIHRGHSSGMPVCLLKFNIVDSSGITQCPFLKPVFFKELMAVNKENKTEQEYKTELKKIVIKNIKAGRENLVCSIHKNRPEVCRLYPLGRALQADKKTKKQTTKYFLLDRKNLLCSDNCYLHKNKIKDYLNSNQIPEYQDIQKRYNQLIMKLADVTIKKEFTKEDYAQVANIFYNFDSVLMWQSSDKKTKDMAVKEAVDVIQGTMEGIPKLDKNILMDNKDIRKTCNYLLDIQEEVVNNLVKKYAKRNIPTQKRL